MRRLRWLLSGGLLGLVALSSVPSSATKEIGTAGDPFSLRSPKFDHQAEIPTVYTCDGDDASPPLTWTGEPQKTQSLALLVIDPDAAEAAHRSWTHWVVVNIPPIARALNETIRTRRELPHGAREGVNDWQHVGYTGPCPPPGRRHHYLFKLFALDADLEVEAPTSAVLEREMQGHVLARAELIGTYERKK
jgi:Raf kinase inhibitor-like YbhB/YbcL family protein